MCLGTIGIGTAGSMADAWQRTSGQHPVNRIQVHGDSNGDVIDVPRDASLNAVGGVRLPDLQLARGQYLALGPSVPNDAFDPLNVLWLLAGGFETRVGAPIGFGLWGRGGGKNGAAEGASRLRGARTSGCFPYGYPHCLRPGRLHPKMAAGSIP